MPNIERVVPKSQARKNAAAERKSGTSQRVSRFADRIEWTDESATKYTSILLCGTPGVGKTHVAGTCPDPIFANADIGLKTVAHRHWPSLKFEHGTPTWLELMQFIWDVRDNIPPFDKFKSQSFVIDSASSLSSHMETELLNENFDPEDDNAEVKEKLEWGDYNIIKNRLISLFNEAKKLQKMHLVVTCGLSWEKDDTSGEMFDQPDVTGKKFGPVMPGYFDNVLLLERNKAGVFVARLRPTKRFPYAKVRIPGGDPDMVLPEMIENPTFDKLMHEIDKVVAHYNKKPGGKK